MENGNRIRIAACDGVERGGREELIYEERERGGVTGEEGFPRRRGVLFWHGKEGDSSLTVRFVSTQKTRSRRKVDG